MLQTQTESNNTDHAGANLVAVGLAGLIAGAAGVTVLALSDKDIRRKAYKRAKEVKDVLQKWSSEKLMVTDHDQEMLEKESKKAAEEVTQMHEEKLHN